MSPLGRWLGYLAGLGLTGAAGFVLLLRARLGWSPPELMAHLVRRTRRLALLCGILLLVSALLRLYGQAVAFVEPGEPVTLDLLTTILGTAWGKLLLAQVAIAAVSLVLLPLLPAAWILPPVALVVALAAPLTGHAVENPLGRWPGTLIHGVHQLGGGVWLGTLAMVMLVGYGASRRAEPGVRHRLIAELVSGFSPLALAGVTVAVGAGVVLTWQYVGSWAALVQSGYSRVLAVKVALLLTTAMLGAWNWRRVRPALGEALGTARLARSATAELMVGTLLLVATAWLTGMEMPAAP